MIDRLKETDRVMVSGAKTLKSRRRGLRAALGLLLAAFLCGCSAQDYAQQADDQVYGIISEKQERVFGDEKPFSIDTETEAQEVQAAALALARDEQNAHVSDADPILTMGEALAVAFLNNRDYQTQKESLFTQTLSLTQQIHNFETQYNGGFSLDATRDAGEVEGAFGASAGFSRLLANGAEFTVDFTTALARFFTGDQARAASSLLAMTFTQPLWRNAGRLVVQENLTQTDRDVLYNVRALARFQQTLVVRIASGYLNVLLRERVMNNERLNYESLIQSTERIEALAEAQRLPQFQVDQARQNELAARSRWVRATEDYEARLDDFKLLLGIPTDTPIRLDAGELDRLAQGGLTHPKLPLPDAIQTAMDRRYDLANVQDEIEDAERKLRIARKQLEGDATLTVGADAGTPDSQLLRFDLDEDSDYAIGLDVDLPLERLAERNAYRQTIINVHKARRDLGESRDRIILEVRSAHRRLQQAKENYQIDQASVLLAESRVDSTTLLLEAGRVETRDVLDAQTALVLAKNAVAESLVEHTAAKLEFFRDIGTIEIDEKAPVDSLVDPGVPEIE